MARLILGDRVYHLDPGETVLDCLLRHQEEVDYGCRAGVCQSCLLQAEEPVPASAQTGLKDTLKRQRYFLACSYRPETDLHIRIPARERFSTEVIAHHRLTPEIVRLRLAVPAAFSYRPGQYVNLFHQGQVRSYSLASLPGEPFLEFHIRRVPGGLFSTWIFEALHPGDTVQIGPALGECFYTPEAAEQPLLLIGTGSGLAPLYGILRDALEQGHREAIYLYHGSSTLSGLYLQEALQALACDYSQFHYVPCLSRTPVPDGIRHGRASALALADHPQLENWRIYLCGNPEMVRSAQRRCFLAGASMQAIHADPFLSANDSQAPGPSSR
ncbi:CDP-4-dehydro-6-deoxyglucose reductase, E3 [Methylomarinovum tepidoasis]|uniref:CDP-4-dehydro-6-deoxyglucose reductase, E3 n=1 Tax=Methylomarinovum tepidoasis TaxID=2840183 RepID=A0AAU9CEW6_9GAMM|nr:FAD-binding oxidoreductase [Methylomarinovum sp. IN45]BCX88763.1 CDP-4-dehydro-6-deoxyglucose reductase, E3 [Methylomarinovum sp. IN45]